MLPPGNQKSPQKISAHSVSPLASYSLHIYIYMRKELYNYILTEVSGVSRGIFFKSIFFKSDFLRKKCRNLFSLCYSPATRGFPLQILPHSVKQFDRLQLHRNKYMCEELYYIERLNMLVQFYLFLILNKHELKKLKWTFFIFN